jgi:RHS repeat-associated protein
VTDWNTQVSSYGYDNANRLTTTTYPNGVVSTNSYDNADRLTGISTVKSPTTILSITYTLDNVGNRLTMVEQSGTTTYTYDDLNRLLSVDYPSGLPDTVSYTYDAMGNRLTLTADAVTTTYIYDNADRLTSTTGGSALSFTWDDNGQMLSKGSQTFTWDALGRMSGLTNGATTASYAYNGDGVRIQRTVDSTTTSYLQDLASGLPVVLSETTGATTSRYVYGADLIALVESTPSYYHADGLGSTRAITDASGLSTDQYAYDAFGASRSHTGSSATSFTYTGEQVDPEAGLVFLRARYYDAMLGRFFTKDVLPGIDTGTQAKNRFVYVLNNPIRLIDPSGSEYDAYSSIRVSAFFGLGVSVQYSEYYDTATGKTTSLWNAGFGAGLPGVNFSTEVGASTADVPNESMSFQTHGGLDLGAGNSLSTELNLTTGNASINPRVGFLQTKLSSDLNVSSALKIAYGSEASGTFNISFRTGALGDWLFDQFVQPIYDTQYYDLRANHYRQMTEIINRRTQYQNWLNTFTTPSQGK